MKIKNIILVLLSVLLILVLTFSLVYASPTYPGNDPNACVCTVTLEECGFDLNPIPFTGGSGWPFRYCKELTMPLAVYETMACGQKPNIEYYTCNVEGDKFTVDKSPGEELIDSESKGYLGKGQYKFRVNKISDSECVKKKVNEKGGIETVSGMCTEYKTSIPEESYLVSEEQQSLNEESSCCIVALGDDVESFQFSGDRVSRDGPYADGVTSVIKVKQGTPITYGFWWRPQGSDGSKPSSWIGAYDGKTVCDSDVKVIPTDEHKTSVWKLPNDGYLDRFGDIYPLFVEIDPIKREDLCGVKVRKTKKSSDQVTQTPKSADVQGGSTNIGSGSNNTQNNSVQNNSQNSNTNQNNNQNSLACGCALKINDDVRVNDNLRNYIEEKKVKKGSSILYKYGVDIYENERDALSPDLPGVIAKDRITKLMNKVCQENEDIIIPSDDEIYSLAYPEDSGSTVLKVILSKYGNARPLLLDVQINEQDLCGGEVSYDSQEGTIAPEFNIFTIIITLLVSLLTISIIRVRKTK